MPAINSGPFDTAGDALEEAVAITNDAAASPVYSGTASVTNGSPTVNLVSGPPFNAAMQGIGLSIGGVTYQVGIVVSPTQITLTTNYTGGTSSSVSWIVTPALLTGNVLNPLTNPAVWPLINHCWRLLEDELLKLGVETFTKIVTLSNITPTAAALPRSDLYIDWDGYWDGNTTWDTVVLPDDLLMPLECWETLSNSTQQWEAMRQAPDQLRQQTPSSRWQQWGWWDNTLYLPQSTQTEDLKIRYLAIAPDITGPTSVLVVPRCQTAMAFLIAAAAAKSRGGLEMVAVYKNDADEAIARIASRTARREDYSQFVRRAFRGGHRGPGRGRGFLAGPVIQP